MEKELERLNEVLKKDFDATVKQNEEQIDKNFMNFKARSEVGSRSAVDGLDLLFNSSSVTKFRV